MSNRERTHGTHVRNARLLFIILSLAALPMLLLACGGGSDARSAQNSDDKASPKNVASENSSPENEGSDNGSRSSEDTDALIEKLNTDSDSVEYEKEDGEYVSYSTTEQTTYDLKEDAKLHKDIKNEMDAEIQDAQKASQKAIEVAKSYKERGLKLDSLDRRCNAVNPLGLAEANNFVGLDTNSVESANSHEKTLKEAISEASKLPKDEKAQLAEELESSKDGLKELQATRADALKAFDEYKTTYKYQTLEARRLDKQNEATSKSVNCWL